MKLILSLIILSSSLAFAQDEKPMKFKKKAHEYIFLKKVESALRTHDADLMMSFMEPSYKRTQHDEFLEGRTVQFLNEFICMEVKFNEIDGAQLISYVASKDTKNQFEVRFYLRSASQSCYATFYMVKNPSTGVLSLFGAVG